MVHDAVSDLVADHSTYGRYVFLEVFNQRVINDDSLRSAQPLEGGEGGEEGGEEEGDVCVSNSAQPHSSHTQHTQ